MIEKKKENESSFKATGKVFLDEYALFKDELYKYGITEHVKCAGEVISDTVIICMTSTKSLKYLLKNTKIKKILCYWDHRISIDPL